MPILIYLLPILPSDVEREREERDHFSVNANAINKNYLRSSRSPRSSLSPQMNLLGDRIFAYLPTYLPTWPADLPIYVFAGMATGITFEV